MGLFSVGTCEVGTNDDIMMYMNEIKKYLQFGKYTKDCPDYILKKIRKGFGGEISRNNLFVVLSFIREEFSSKKYKTYKTNDFRKSRFVSVKDIFEKRQESCGAWAAVVASFLRSLGVPVKLINGFYEKEIPDMRHAWNEVYVDGNWLSIDLTRKDFKVGDKHIKIDEWVDWSDLETIYKSE
jgi:hypothetical protein